CLGVHTRWSVVCYIACRCHADTCRPRALPLPFADASRTPAREDHPRLPAGLATAAVVLSFFFSSRRRHTRCHRDWSSDVCSSDLASGLRRPLGAVWPEPVTHEHAGRLELWVGRVDVAKSRQGPWPLLRGGQADVFQAIPFGTDVRG